MKSVKGVDVIVRSDQEKRWEFPKVVSLYGIHYTDGEKQTVPLVTGRTSDDWALPPEAEEAFVGLQGNPWHLNVLAVKLREVTIDKIIFRDLGTPAAPVLAAVTLDYQCE